MASDPSLLLDFALRRGFLSTDQVQECQEELDAAPDPLAFLIEKKLLSADDARVLQELLVQYNRDQEISQKLLREGVLTSDAAQSLRQHQLQSISSGRLLSLQEAARELNLQIEDELERRDAETKRLQRFDRYEIRRELGRGGMGVVYEARDPKLDRNVALKILRGGAGKTDLERFHREAHVMAKLHHPGIVSVYDVGERNEQPYFVMELVEGKDLRKSVERRMLSRREGVDLLRQTAEAVAFAHEHGVLHRDLKPENILVTADKRAVVMDFGLAKLQEGADRSLSVSGEVLGTPAYMSPEQARGKWHEVDARTDVWGIGTTLYYVLTTAPPFFADSLNATLNQVIHADPVPPRAVHPDIDANLNTICLKALEKHPERRYATMKDLAEDLRRYLAGEPILARPPGLAYRVGKWVAKRRVLVSIVVASFLVGAGVWWTVAAMGRARTFRESKAAALAAHQKRDWAKARIESDRALAVRNDAELREIREEADRKLTEAENRARLHARLTPVEDLIRDTRQVFYIKTVDLRKRLGRVEEALDDLGRFLVQPEYGSFPEGWRVLGLGWYLVGDWTRAESALCAGERLDAEDGWINLYLSKILLERSLALLFRMEDEATEETQVQAKEWSQKALERLRRPARSWEGAEEIDRQIAQAYRALAEGDRSEVVRLCSEGLRRYEKEIGSEEFRNLLGWVREGDARIQEYTQAIERRPHYAWAYFMRGTLRHATDPAGAVADYTASLEINPRFSFAYRNRGIALLLLKDPKAAIADLTQALQWDPESGLAHYHRGVAYQESKDAESALKDLDAAIRWDPRLVSAQVHRGDVLRGRGENVGALAAYAEAIRIDTEEARRLGERAAKALEAEKAQGAFEDFSGTFLRFTRLSQVALQCSFVHAQLKQFDEMQKVLAMGTEFGRTSAAALVGLGRARCLLGNPQEALGDFSQAIQLDPGCADAFYYRALNRLPEDRAGAAEDLRRALSAAPPAWMLRAECEKKARELEGRED